MKNILLSAFLISLYFFGSAQDMKSMSARPSDRDMSEKENKTEVLATSDSPPKTVRYDLYVADTTVNFTGKPKHAIAINGSIPAPTLYFTEGDTAEIYVHNTMHMETSIHWHGIILPNQYDGVPHLTTQPIAPHTTHLFKFPIVQNGTYFYHSHTMFQEQSGMYGALVFRKRKVPSLSERAKGEAEYTMVLSDWTDEMPPEISRRLHNATDWYAIRKGSTQSYAEAIRTGHFKTKITNEWKRMLAMDVSDVAYDRFLNNGEPVNEQPEFKAGDKVRLRVINGSSSTYFWLQFAGGKLSVVANDGQDVVPVEVDRLIIGVSETYDVVVTIPENMSYEFRATAEDRTGYSSLWLGNGMKMKAPTLPPLKYFEGMKMMNDMMKMNGDMKPMEGMEMSNQTMDMNNVMYPEITGDIDDKKGAVHDMETHKKDTTGSIMKTGEMAGMDMGHNSDIVTLNYGMLLSPFKTTLRDGPTKVLHFDLTGNMNRYVWSINNKTVSESDKILIKKGENVRIILRNNTMMRHPMHLHGHFFRVLNEHGEYSPLKTVLDIMPMETDTLEFAATESGDWFFHCHILYHMMSGMGRVFSYENSPPNPQLPDTAKAYKKFRNDHKMWYPMVEVGLESNGSDGSITLANTRYRLQTEWHIGLNKETGYESESHFGRYFGEMQWLFPYVGWDFRKRTLIPGEKNIFGQLLAPKKNLFGQTNTRNFRQVFHVGVEYTLPMLVIADGSVDSEGKFRFQLSRGDIGISKRLRFNFMVNTDKEYSAGFRYITTKWLALSTHLDSDMGLGAGITLTY